MDIHFKYKYDDLFNPTLNALKNLGYNCELWVYNGKKKKLKNVK